MDPIAIKCNLNRREFIRVASGYDSKLNLNVVGAKQLSTYIDVTR